ncbi:Membrane-bound lytic murein transglycosylase B precursor [Pseudovibrio axinellae]|uniref:Membrane-bound lytic murein transglycosylase B n=1 Tax=Pseudovibrio axinellae TaxID=989403 RepID=A0A165U1T1_9HYPH|nr:Membrane-bound lytic murein transglycosylase B precursor [Pseudovibrio axinellae]SEQ64391.1 lytic murein transglycosylase [Pseudovibrio axinellae]
MFESFICRVKSKTRKAGLLLGAGLMLLGVSSAQAATCGDTGAGFDSWLASYKKTLQSKGISRSTLNKGLSGVTYNRKVIGYDRNQKSFKLSFDEFYRLRVNNALINKGRRLMKKHNGLFTRIENEFGVPREIITAIWGLETGYGRGIGNMSTLRSLATLAYDCRRANFFRNELYNALLIVQKGDLNPSQMKGAWAGELGQTQFLASSYIKFAIDYSGDGKRDLLYNTADTLASTAHFLNSYGWRKGQPWGPGTSNYGVIRSWNRAGVYVKTIQIMAEKLSN